MKHLRSAISTATAVLVLSIAGCSDQFTSPVSMKTDISGNTGIASGKIESEKFYTRLSLKPNQIHEFSFENTGYYTFNSISILNCGVTKNDIEVSGFGDDQMLLLGCNSSGFTLWSIYLRNTTNHDVEVDIFLTGSKSRIKKIRHPREF